jgi:hypothetical protein
MAYQAGTRKALSAEQLAEAQVALTRWRAAQETKRIADEAAEEERARLLAIIGDAQFAVDSDGRIVYSAPERSRRTMPVVEALELAPILASVVKTSTYRVISK